MDPKEANLLCEKNHYLHRRRVGKLVAFGVWYLGDFIGVLLFARAMVCSPMYGYQPKEIVELARVWFSSNPKNLGSCAIRKALTALPAAWPGTRAVISWCDRTKFDGALYKATGFAFMGQSRIRSIEPSAKTYGGGRPDRKVHSDRVNLKDIYLLRLREHGRVVVWRWK